MSYQASSNQPQRRGCGCCGTGCLLLLLLLLLLAVAGGALYLQVPQKLGLLQSPAERLLSKTPDREAAATILQDLRQAGLSTTGMELYVLPYLDGDGAMAYAVLDMSQGFTFPQSTTDPVVDFLKSLAQGEATQRYGVKRVAVELRTEEGGSPITVTASTRAIQDYANGRISRAALMEAIDGKMDLVSLVKEVYP